MAAPIAEVEAGPLAALPEFAASSYRVEAPPAPSGAGWRALRQVPESRRRLSWVPTSTNEAA
jgi:hypothetical protein